MIGMGRIKWLMTMFSPLLQLKLREDLPELPCAKLGGCAGLAGQPLCPADCAQGEAAPRVGVMPYLQYVVLAFGGDNVLALGVAHTMRGDGYIDPRPHRENDLLERGSRA